MYWILVYSRCVGEATVSQAAANGQSFWVIIGAFLDILRFRRFTATTGLRARQALTILLSRSWRGIRFSTYPNFVILESISHSAYPEAYGLAQHSHIPRASEAHDSRSHSDNGYITDLNVSQTPLCLRLHTLYRPRTYGISDTHMYVYAKRLFLLQVGEETHHVFHCIKGIPWKNGDTSSMREKGWDRGFCHNDVPRGWGDQEFKYVLQQHMFVHIMTTTESGLKP